MNIKILLTIALVCPVFLLLNCKSSDEDRKMIQGTWVILEAQLGGQKLPDEIVKGTNLILSEGTYQYLNDRGEYKLFPTEETKAMDIVGREGPNQGKNILAIYELDGNKLKICYDLTGKRRPTKFATEAGTQQLLVNYQR